MGHNTVSDEIMTFWFKCQPKLIHDYSLVGYILSPHPRIMNDARVRMLESPIYSDAIKSLIGKRVAETLISKTFVDVEFHQTSKYLDDTCMEHVETEAIFLSSAPMYVGS